LFPRRTEVPRSIIGTPLRRRTSRVAALLAAPAAAVALLSGCGAGQVNQTGRMVAPVSGVEANTKHGLAGLRDVQIKYNSPEGYPAGATAPLSLYIANNNPGTQLVLKSVTAVNRQSGAPLGTVVLMGGTPETGVLPRGEPSATAAGSRGPSAIPSASASRKASATPSASRAASAGTAPSAGASEGASATPPSVAPGSSPAGVPLSLTIPANGYARLEPGHGAYLAITTIAEALQPGSSALVTFTFEGEDPLEVPVPFGVPLSPAPRLTPSSGGHGAE
jgi:hypothetical protein